MDFYVSKHNHFLTSDKNHSYVFLYYNNGWNDYNYITTFEAYYYDNSTDEKIDLDTVKILRDDLKEKEELELGNHFKKLSDKYCSLGQNLDYYKKLSNLDKEIYKEILGSLNDVVYNRDIKEKFYDNDGFQTSLIRYGGAQKALEEGIQFFDDDFKIEKRLDFSFKCELPNAKDFHEINFDFNKNANIPYRITTIIGKNGTGKTEYLTSIANAMSGVDLYKGEFDNKRPSFGNVITISYSIFDEFKLPEIKDISYHYCGIRSNHESSKYNIDNLSKRLKESLKKIEKKDNIIDWKMVLKEIINIELLNDIYDDFKTEEYEQIEAFNSLSSGQSMILATMTDVIANIEEDTLILYDEPEMHLHPNAIAKLIKMLYELLDKFDSYAIISTHSPIILQQIPSEYVRVFEREGDLPIVRDLRLESFGENLTTLTNEVFNIIGTESNYKNWFKKLSETHTFDEINSYFEKDLSFNAKVFLSNIFDVKGDSR
ncbi:MAG: AAA family ATPase [bacterium]